MNFILHPLQPKIKSAVINNNHWELFFPYREIIYDSYLLEKYFFKLIFYLFIVTGTHEVSTRLSIQSSEYSFYDKSLASKCVRSKWELSIFAFLFFFLFFFCHRVSPSTRYMYIFLLLLLIYFPPLFSGFYFQTLRVTLSVLFFYLFFSHWLNWEM